MPVVPAGPGAPAGPERSISNAAGWLVAVFSLLSKITDVVEGFAMIRNPLLGFPLSHPCTCPVTGTTM
jgi:hypothetical protein